MTETIKYNICRNKKDLIHTVFPAMFSFIFFGFISYLTCAFIETGISPDEDKILKDIFLQEGKRIFKKYDITSKLPEYLIISSLLLIFIRLILLKEKFCLILRRGLFCISFMFFLRPMFLLTTRLPSPNVDCVPNQVNGKYFEYAFKFFIQMHLTCDDVFYSGHTSFFMALLLLYIDYPINIGFIKQSLLDYFIITVISLKVSFSIFSLVASGYHYTIDVLSSSILYFVIWRFYHLVVQCHLFDDKWYGILINWFDNEDKAKDSISITK